jgi:hypothetical protein
LEPLIFADLKNDLLGARELVEREPVMPVNEERDIVVTSGEGRSRNLVDRTPRKSERCRLIERNC